MTAPQRIAAEFTFDTSRAILNLIWSGAAQYDGFDATARRAIECDNALSLLPTLRERSEAAGR